MDPSFWSGRKVLVTGHTGFKGAWLTLWLTQLGADVVAVSDAVPTEPSLFALSGAARDVDDRRADVRDRAAIAALVREVKPEVVLHLAAQPFVRRSFREPVETYAINVMGTAHLLDAVRLAPSARAVVIVTSDKCYDNREQARPFVEDDPMGGHDPYSNSKGAAELVADAYRRSYFSSSDGAPGPRVASVRAGNVIGGGDWGEDRLVPDILRGALAGTPIAIRRPDAIRPWQHVLNPLSGYLEIAERLATDPGGGWDAGWNFGPDPDDVQPVQWIVDRLTERWPGELEWRVDPGPHPHEATYLALSSDKAHERLGWRPTWRLDQALDAIVDWTVALRDGADVRATTLGQIARFTGS